MEAFGRCTQMQVSLVLGVSPHRFKKLWRFLFSSTYSCSPNPREIIASTSVAIVEFCRKHNYDPETGTILTDYLPFVFILKVSQLEEIYAC